MTLYDVVTRLAGPIQPVGKHEVDQERLSNLFELADLVEDLLGDISRAAGAAERPEASMQAIGKYAKEFLHNIAEYNSHGN